MVLKGTINNISQPHVHAGSDITTGEINPARLPEIPHSMYRQAIINGNFDVWQRGTSFTSTTTPANNDNTYIADRWTLLSDGNNVVEIIRSSTAPIGSRRAARFKVVTANKKFGIIQFIESEDAMKFLNNTVSLSFQAQTIEGAAIRNIRAAVLSWNGTADAVTSDVVSAWNAEGADPTLVSNWTYENTPSNIALTTGYQTFKIEGISIDTSGMTNLAVFIWCDDTDCAANDYLYLSQIQLCAGDVALPFEPKSFAEELNSCLRYCWMPGWSTNATYGYIIRYRSISTNLIRFDLYTSVIMRVIPTMIGAVDGTNIIMKTLSGGSSAGWTYSVSDFSGEDISIQADKISHGLTDGYVLIASNAGLYFDAEL